MTAKVIERGREHEIRSIRHFICLCDTHFQLCHLLSQLNDVLCAVHIDVDRELEVLVEFDGGRRVEDYAYVRHERLSVGE